MIFLEDNKEAEIRNNLSFAAWEMKPVLKVSDLKVIRQAECSQDPHALGRLKHFLCRFPYLLVLSFLLIQKQTLKSIVQSVSLLCACPVQGTMENKKESKTASLIQRCSQSHDSGLDLLSC